MTNVVEIATRFAGEIFSGDVNAAHGRLTQGLAAEVSAADLSSAFEALAEDMGGVTAIGDPMVILEEWPEKARHDLAVVYVPLHGDVYSEAVTVTVSEVDGSLRISSIEWGRP